MLTLTFYLFQDYEKLKRFLERNWKCDLPKVDQSVRGWNYGAANFEGKRSFFVYWARSLSGLTVDQFGAHIYEETNGPAGRSC